MIKTEVTIGKLKLKNPVLVASGTFGYGDELIGIVDINKLGGIVTKSLTLKPKLGNPPPRIVETPCGMLNSIGLANIGVDKFINEKLPILKNFDTAIIVNIAAKRIEDYCEIIKRLEDTEGISAYEINISCPNVKEGGLEFGTNLEMTRQIVNATRKITDKTLIIKLTPNVTRISEFAKVCKEEGADAVSLINTIVGMAIDIKTRKPKISTITGGLSGPAIKPIALAKVFEVFQNVDIPIIGIGGITTWEDAIEFMIAGAKAIQVGTANFIDPSTPLQIISGLVKYCEENKVEDINEIVGSIIVESLPH
ncbi:dihydroorotate oxidase B, catalytic subunit [Candidatus Kryptonium thompsonii]|uniref:Dihydroorotate dehydrogenase n=2 Tax=Candidatus Kryptonium thompsonii TaxID=1633631 RepID=A0A0P1LQB3_9BACT|nr:dihydroorotate oxidase B, catalytic subunit [Candidatus Kryptonium thompsoni]CUS82658.1 dihydroorotate oxidase B, catalytic subunit [Candidatus Kryptonium thompsoni]CUS83985.1 dihydroorotate oxidase B, catalytic subunit [Candidatus Kryptonium thompsoni]CUS87674.1 dihydroorotate oxidase B, catalytic subunit [Candidatus Kryptonium thompsoni]CUS88429.1 dihydroorotate oxidase B, catalytic subunit [Candidatus Kryptonium thompsoni]